MVRFSVIAIALAAAACGHELDDASTSENAAPQNEAVDLVAATGEGEGEGEEGEGEGEGEGEEGEGEGEAPVLPGPPPSEANQSCSEWTDCGPYFVDANSGFECTDGQCVCGDYADACASIGGAWSAYDCYCYVGAAAMAMPMVDANEWQAPGEEDEDDDARVCWWRYRDRCYQEWIDEGGYEYVCRGGGNDDCGYEYVDDGYYEENCDDSYWVRVCDDGTVTPYY